MPRKYKILRLSITNTLYRRFTNPNRKFTPRSIRTKYLNMRVNDHKRLYYTTTPHSIRCSRIYHITGNFNLLGKRRNPDCDVRFDFSSHNIEFLKILANSLSSKDLACVCAYEDIGSGNNKLLYTFPFVQGIGGSFKTETSSQFYPGIYYSRGVWLWADKLSYTITEIQGFKVGRSINTTDYTDSEEIEHDLNEAQNNWILNRAYFIFIPYTAIESPVLQAYLPLSDTIAILKGRRGSDEGHLCTYTDQSIIWMGREFHPVQKLVETVSKYTGNYSALDSSQYTGTPSTLLSKITTQYLSQYLYAGYSFTSLQWVIIPSQISDWEQGFIISGEEDLPECIQLQRAYASQDITVLNYRIDSPTQFGTVYSSVKKDEPSPRLGALVRFDRVSESLPTVYILVGIVIDYSPVTESVESWVFTHNREMSKLVLDIIYSNTVPTDTGFSHLSRSGTVPVFYQDPEVDPDNTD